MSANLADRVPLVLSASAVVKVRIDNQAVRVHAHNRADQWFPLKRLSELRCYGEVALGPDVLPHCLRRGIGVHWFEAAGQWLGWAVPASAKVDPDIEHLLLEFLGLPDWQTRLQYFIAAQERHLMRGFLNQSRLHANDMRPDAVRAQALAAIQMSANLGQVFIMQLRHVMLARVAIAWAAAGLPAAFTTKLPKRMAPTELLANLTDWKLFSVVWQVRARIDRICRDPVDRLAFIERHLPDTDRLVADWMRNFCHWLAQQSHE